ncbi:MAG: ferrochelatase [Candidatus Dormibacteria bacterium]
MSARPHLAASAASGRPEAAPGRPTAVLLMAYGSPRSEAEILPYYTHMRGGRPPSPQALDELRRRYSEIGGSSPLQEITASQAEALAKELRRRGRDWLVRVGMKHSPPLIEEAILSLAEEGVAAILGLVLAPHYSSLSVGEYQQRAQAAAADRPQPPHLTFVSDWHLAPGYLDWLAGQVRSEVAALGGAGAAAPLVIFTAHSLPARLRELGDPYPDQLGETAAAVADRCQLGRWTTAWQSVARTGEPWLGPELAQVIETEAQAGATRFVVCACGFTADHLEILYDLDLEARRQAERLGVTLRRTAMPNADPGFIRVLADLVEAALAGGG